MLLVRREFNEYHKIQKEELPNNDVPNLFDAAAWGTVEELDEALKHWDVNAVDENGMTALHHAGISLKFDNVDRILAEVENGFDAEVEDKFGRDAAYAVVEVHGSKDPNAKKMYDMFSPHVYPITEEDLDLYADDAPEV